MNKKAKQENFKQYKVITHFSNGSKAEDSISTDITPSSLVELFQSKHEAEIIYEPFKITHIEVYEQVYVHNSLTDES